MLVFVCLFLCVWQVLTSYFKVVVVVVLFLCVGGGGGRWGGGGGLSHVWEEAFGVSYVI